jgi:O-antigen/teichoic acid export membrane protein
VAATARSTAAAHDQPVRRSQFAWGFVDQAIASATTFGLTLAVARGTGPAGVGALAIAWAAFLVLLGAQRALLIEPFLTRVASSRVSDERALGGSLVLSVIGGLAGTAAFLVIGGLGSSASTGFLAFAPWMAPLMAQNLLRTAAFRWAGGAVAASGSAVFLATFAVLVLGGLNGSVRAMVAAWGAGATLSVLWLFFAGKRPGWLAPRAAARWWRSEQLRFGGWLVAGVIATAVFSYGLLGGLAAISGASDVGGYRVIESVFSPLSLLAVALANPGIRAVRHSFQDRPAAALTLAWKISGVAVLCMVAYAVVVGSAQDLVFRLFGEEFSAYSDLILPIALAQTLIAAAIGPETLLRAARKGRAVVLVGAGGPALACLIGLPLAALYGFTAAVWGIALAFVPPLVWAVVASRLAVRRRA